MIREVFPTEMALAAALASRIAAAIRRHPPIVIGLPTGRTPLALYAELRRVTMTERLDWSRVRTFNLDEFVGLGQGDPRSYRTFMQEQLFDHVNAAPPHIAIPDGRAADPAAECERYEHAIAAAGGLDLMILGIGANGHIGFNEPAAALVARTHRAALDAATRAANAWWFGGDVSRVPQEAITMGMATILQARAIVMIATGEAKAEAVHAMCSGGVTTAVPASFLQLHPQCTLALDEPLADALATPR